MNKTLYVCLPRQTTDLSALEELFTTVGDVTGKNLERNPYSLNEAMIGIIEMSTEKQAVDCMERFHGYVMNGYALSIKSSPPTAPPPRKQRKA